MEVMLSNSQVDDKLALSTKDRLRSLRAAAVGNLLEWFDWTLYGMLSVYLAANFFDDSDPTSALLATMAVFAGGFIARPLGGYVFGLMGDKIGRRAALLTTMLTMSLTTLAVGLAPTYDQIGAWASVVLLALRILQGLAHGGEAGVSYTYVAEIAPKERRGLWSSAVYVSVMIGVMAATATAALLTNLLSSEAMNDWGWRLGFVLGSVLAVYVLYLRRAAKESAVFAEQEDAVSEKGWDEKAPKRKLSVSDKKKLIKGSLFIFLLSGATNVVYYTWVTFAPTNAQTVHGMDPGGSYIASLAAQVLGLGFLIFAGHMSDKIGRRPMIMAFGAAVIIVIFPTVLLLSDQPWTLFVTQTLGLFAWALAVGFYPAIVSELAPTFARARVVGIMASVAAAVFGGTAPYLYTWLMTNGMAWVFYVYLGVLAAVAATIGLIIKETRGMDLSEDIYETGIIDSQITETDDVESLSPTRSLGQ